MPIVEAVMAYVSSLALNFTFESDAERRKQRLPPRMDITSPSRGLVDLPGQGKGNCTEINLRLQVGYSLIEV